MRRSLRETEPQIRASPFMLLQGGEERRLNIGERVSLPTRKEGQAQIIDSLIALEIQPNSDYLLLGITENGSGVNARWGMIPKGLGNDKKEFGSTLTDHVLTLSDGKRHIKGSSLYFDEPNLHLYGDGWVLEYRPL